MQKQICRPTEQHTEARNGIMENTEMKLMIKETFRIGGRKRANIQRTAFPKCVVHSEQNNYFQLQAVYLYKCLMAQRGKCKKKQNYKSVKEKMQGNFYNQMVGKIQAKRNPRAIKKRFDTLNYIRIFNFSVMTDTINKVKQQVTGWKLHSGYKSASACIHQ